ncbi:MAG: polysaccharide export protein [Nitratireductor sp.]|nr:polysaccharide export protein [Nitratireductor sp.]MCB1454922.1 polysaccharide export protein [Nitratireductor sp.]MCB1459266.1 polysaccharide export protein [Nitratireductor sp.]
MLRVNSLISRNLLMAVVASALLGGCSTYRPVDEAFHAALQQPYKLDSGDRLRVTVFGQTDLTNTYSVDKAGYLAFPLVGSVQARGQTPKQVEGQLAAKLRNGFLRNPDVSVEVDRYRPVFIMGEVGAPGQYTYVPGMTVQNAIALAGGYSGRALQDNADITRQVNGQVLNGRVPISDPVLPGDTIYVRERLF